MPTRAGPEKRGRKPLFLHRNKRPFRADPLPCPAMNAEPADLQIPSLGDIRTARDSLGDRIHVTPVLALAGPAVDAAFAPGTRALLKLELFQRTGSFKARAALLNVLALTAEQRARGVCAISAGNHAIATAFAARTFGASAKVVMKAERTDRRAAAVLVGAAG
jgi:threonine dehydratase